MGRESENTARVNQGGRFEGLVAFGAWYLRQGVFVILNVQGANRASLPPRRFTMTPDRG